MIEIILYCKVLTRQGSGAEFVRLTQNNIDLYIRIHRLKIGRKRSNVWRPGCLLLNKTIMKMEEIFYISLPGLEENKMYKSKEDQRKISMRTEDWNCLYPNWIAHAL